MSSSVCYVYFSPVIDKRQPICYAVKYWTVIFNTNFFVFDSTLVTKENLNFKKMHNNNEYVTREWN